MLRRILHNRRTVPIPVPVRDLKELRDWLERTLVPDGHAVTRVILNGTTITDYWDAPEKAPFAFSSEHKVEIKSESPQDLAIQSLESIQNLGTSLLSILKPLAVKLWELPQTASEPDIGTVAGDCDLLAELLGHAASLVDSKHVDTAYIYSIRKNLSQISSALSQASLKAQWRAAARYLLKGGENFKGLEVSLQDMINEAEFLQVRLMTL